MDLFVVSLFWEALKHKGEYENPHEIVLCGP